MRRPPASPRPRVAAKGGNGLCQTSSWRECQHCHRSSVKPRQRGRIRQHQWCQQQPSLSYHGQGNTAVSFSNHSPLRRRRSYLSAGAIYPSQRQEVFALVRQHAKHTRHPSEKVGQCGHHGRKMRSRDVSKAPGGIQRHQKGRIVLESVLRSQDDALYQIPAPLPAEIRRVHW